jgi:hypothetical protein
MYTGMRFCASFFVFVNLDQLEDFGF